MRAALPRHCSIAVFVTAIAVIGTLGTACGPPSDTRLTLRQVVLYQNGIGYFQHTGVTDSRRVDLTFRRYEIGDVLKTITVIPVGGAAGRSAVVAMSASAPESGGGDRANGDGSTDRVHLSIDLTAAARELSIAYAVPTSTWKSSYRVVLPERGQTDALLQAWATVNNTSDADWNRVALTLATGAPLSFAIDLVTPQFVPRPDVTGTMVTPVTLGGILSENAAPGDEDGDGIADTDDLCVREPEDRDAFEDADGCPDPDNDKDRILDVDDQCPNDPEVYNGMEDEDGCPDRGRVVVSDARIEILDKVYFKNASATVRAASKPLLDAVAATLSGNPDITVVSIQGHAANDESDPWGLSRRRAEAVKLALRQRGVQTSLPVEPFGATRPVAPNTSADGRARNRRVEFHIVARRTDAPSGGSTRPAPRNRPARVTTSRMKRSVRSDATPRDVAGTVRFDVGEPVTIPGGSAALVPIVNQVVTGEEIFLFRPESSAAGSQSHPWRAARLQNQTGVELPPGPVAMFAAGSFVGEGILDRLHRGEVALIPYALDSSCTVASELKREERPVRITKVASGVVTVENRDVKIRRYLIDVGARAPARIVIRHSRSYGYEVEDMPPETQDTGSAYLIPIPIQATKRSVYEVVESKPITRRIRLLDSNGATVGEYIGKGDLPKQVADRMTAAIDLRKQMARLDRESDEVRRQMVQVGMRADEVRASLSAIGKDPKAASLRKKLLASLAETTAKTEAISRDLAAKTATRAAVRVRLLEALHELSFERK